MKRAPPPLRSRFPRTQLLRAAALTTKHHRKRKVPVPKRKVPRNPTKTAPPCSRPSSRMPLPRKKAPAIIRLGKARIARPRRGVRISGSAPRIKGSAAKTPPPASWTRSSLKTSGRTLARPRLTTTPTRTRKGVWCIRSLRLRTRLGLRLGARRRIRPTARPTPETRTREAPRTRRRRLRRTVLSLLCLGIPGVSLLVVIPQRYVLHFPHHADCLPIQD